LYTLDSDHAALENQAALERLIQAEEALPLVDTCGGWHNDFTAHYRSVHSNELVNNYAPPDKYHPWLYDYIMTEEGNAHSSSFVDLTNSSLRGTHTACQTIRQVWDSTDNIEGMDSIRGALDAADMATLQTIVYTRSFVFLDGLKIMRKEMLISMSIAASMVVIICVVLLGSLCVPPCTQPLCVAQRPALNNDARTTVARGACECSTTACAGCAVEMQHTVVQYSAAAQDHRGTLRPRTGVDVVSAGDVD